MSVATVVEGVRRRLRRLLHAHAALLMVSLVAGLLLAAWVFVGGGGWGQGSPVPLLLDLAALGALVAGVAWFVRERRNTLDERRISAAMERARGVPDGLLQGALELGRSLPQGVSGALAGRGESTLLTRLDASPGDLAGELGGRAHRRGRRLAGVLALLAPALVLVLLLSPDRSASAWRGLLTPLSVLNGPVLPPLVVEPGDVEVQRGGGITIQVDAAFRETVTLRWQSAGDIVRTAELPVVQDRAVHPFPEISAPTTYSVSAPDGARTREFTITPVDPLFVSDLTVRVQYPAYVDRPPEEFRGDVPPLVLPAGSALGVEGRGSRPLSGASLMLDDDPVRELQVEGPGFRGTLVPGRSGTYDWRFFDAEGNAAALVPPPLEVTLVPDSAPHVAIVLPAADTLLPSSLRQPLVLEASDDYGLRSLELVAWRVTALGDAQAPVSQALDLAGTRNALARPLLDVSGWRLVPGDEVRYYARVVDVHPSGQEARTEEYVLRMPSPDEMRRDAQQQLEDAADRLRALQEEADRAARETRDMERAARAPERSEAGEDRFGESGDQASFQEQEDLRQAVEEQRDMLSRADSLGAELEALSEALQEAGASDPELQADLDELQELLQQMGGENLQAEMQELLDRMDEMGRQEARESMEQLAESQEEFRQRLEEALERAQRAAVEQDFRSATQEAEELAEEQQALAEALAEEEPSPERAAQQDALAQEAEDLQERMESLSERLGELGEERAQETLEAAQEAAQAARQGMEQAAAEARQELSQAARSSQQAAEQMSEAAEALRDAQQQMMAERAEAFQSALQQTAQDALSLARQQAETREAMQGASGDEMADLRGDVSAVQQGVRSLAENLSMAARLAGADERQISARMGQAMEALSRTMEAMERPGAARPSPEAAAERSIAELNQVAQSAMAAIAAMQQGGQQAAASPEEMMEQLEQLAQQQADVNNQAAQMMPLQLTPQAQQQQMEQMAQQQQQVASDLGQLSDQEGEEGPLGDLEAMAQEAEELARQLAGGRLDRDTRERQERLFHRLLDAGRSLEREEESTERESEAPGLFESGEVPPLDPASLGLARYRLPDAASLGRLPPAARALVLEYFQRLNRGEGSGGS
ncbi:MAG TPA: hypothetical protein VK858_21095 [Longimicrobiales bacterium]|nr:hypothetical protein [Longimicrobiales bacterium]